MVSTWPQFHILDSVAISYQLVDIVKSATDEILLIFPTTCAFIRHVKK